MKHFLFIFLLIFYVNHISAQIEIHLYDEDAENFKGDVVSIKFIKYNAINNFGIYVKTGTDSSEITYFFNNLNRVDSINYKGMRNNDSVTGYGKTSYSFINNKWVVTKMFITTSSDYEKNLKIFYTYDKLGNIIESHLYRNDKLEKKEVANYNNTNKLLTYTEYNDSGKKVKERFYEYDTQGNIIVEKFITGFNYFEHKKYVYEKNRFKIEEIWLDENDNITFKIESKFDLQGKNIESNVHSSNNEFEIKKFIYTYNSNGKLESEYRKYPSGEKKLVKTYSYFQNGNIREEKYSNAHKIYDTNRRLIEDSNEFFKHTYKYNNSGSLIESEEISYDKIKDGNAISKKIISSIRKTKYEFDVKGNWIKKIESRTFSETGKNVLVPDTYSITERIIKYK